MTMYERSEAIAKTTATSGLDGDDAAIAPSRMEKVRLFLFAASGGFYVNLGGQLHLAEIAALASLPWALSRIRQFDPRTRRSVSILGGTILCWLVGSIVTWVSTRSSFSDLAKMVAVPVCTWLLAVVIVGLSGCRWNRLEPMLWGCGTAMVMGTLLQPSADAQGDLWKFGLGPGVGLIASMFLVRHSSRPAIIALLVPLSALSFALGSRAWAAILLATCLVGVMSGRGKGIRALSLAGIVGALAMLASVLPGVWTHYALEGRLGEKAFEKAAAQSQMSESMLLSARPEFVFSLAAIEQHPLRGYGPSYTATPGVMERGTEIANGLGLPGSRMTPRTGSIPTHSYLFGGWVGYGILAVPFWCLLSGAVARGFVKSVGELSAWTLPCTFMSLEYAWDLLFSPYGDKQRLVVAALFSLVVVARSESVRNAIVLHRRLV